MKKKCISLLLAAVMVLGMAPTAFAATSEATQAANELHELGLFGGTGTDANGNPVFDLDRAPTRQEAITVLVGLLGKTEEAKAGNWNIPFTDVDNWAKPFVGYAYANGIASGTSATTFGAKDTVTASQYLSFMLRVQGYESGKDFQWNKAWELSDQIGLTDGRYDENTKKFLRGDVVIISLQAYKMMEVLKTAPYYGLPADIKWIPDAETELEVENNMLFAFLFGNYSLEGMGFDMHDMWMAENMFQRLSWTYLDLFGVFCNTRGIMEDSRNGWKLIYESDVFTMDELYKQQMAALEAALTIKAELHENGKITQEMTQKQIAQVYYDYLCGMGVRTGNGSDDARKKGLCVQWDSAYACLVNKKADCGGRAAAFNLLMHVEGITADGVSGETRGGGHIISRVMLDGEQYFCDWGNKKGISKNVSSWFTPDEY